jgi:hypothetical protein
MPSEKAAMTCRKQILFGAIIATSIVITGTRGMAVDEKLPGMDRLAAASLLLVAMAWSFERSCGLSSEKDEALLTRYLSSDDLKRRNKQVADAFPKGGGVIAGAVTRDPSACTKMRRELSG